MEKPVVIRSDIPAKKKYSDYRDELRFDFWYSCAYCALSESEAMGIGFEIDHYYPKEHFPKLISDYGNLFWSCEKCNGYKSDFFPDDYQIEKGNFILRPDKHDPNNHMELENYNLKAKSHTGQFNIELLILNRKMLQKIREIRKRLFGAIEFISFGVPNLARVKLDLFKNPKQRLLFIRIQDEMKKRFNRIFNEDLNILFREFARSPLLDEDPNKKENVKRRREFLREKKVINSDSPLFSKKGM